MAPVLDVSWTTAYVAAGTSLSYEDTPVISNVIPLQRKKATEVLKLKVGQRVQTSNAFDAMRSYAGVIVAEKDAHSRYGVRFDQSQDWMHDLSGILEDRLGYWLEAEYLTHLGPVSDGLDNWL